MAALPSRPLTVLIVEANLAIEEQVFRSLLPYFHIARAHSLAEASNIVRQAPPVIIVLDPDLPDGDGLEWLRYLRAQAETANLVIICVTRRSSIRDKVAGFMAGADDYIIPPVDPETFPYRLTLLSRIRRQ